MTVRRPQLRQPAPPPATQEETAYASNRSALSKRDKDDTVISTVSAAHIQAVMLEQAQLQPGMRVLEIGSGGYNAALIAELVGESGKVVSVDIDPDIVERARDCLAAAGYRQVEVVLADAEDGVPDHAPFDRVIVTVRAWDIPPAWVDQLAVDGRIVVPLRLRGLTRTVALDQVGDHYGPRLAGGDVRLCSFVPMQGAGAHTERLIALDRDRVALRVDGDEQVDEAPLREALFQPRLERWSGVEFDHVDELDLWIGTWLPVFGLLTAQQEPIDKKLVTAGTARCPHGGMAGQFRLSHEAPDRRHRDVRNRSSRPRAKCGTGRRARHRPDSALGPLPQRRRRRTAP
ncbi:MAG: methyltransferase, FxLD system [Pseudonocardia sp.]